MWEYGSLPAAMLAFYGHVKGIPEWYHLTDLGYKHNVPVDKITNASVLHWNGVAKPWYSTSFKEYRHLWFRFVDTDNDLLRQCHVE